MFYSCTFRSASTSRPMPPRYRWARASRTSRKVRCRAYSSAIASMKPSVSAPMAVLGRHIPSRHKRRSIRRPRRCRQHHDCRISDCPVYLEIALRMRRPYFGRTPRRRDRSERDRRIAGTHLAASAVTLWNISSWRMDFGRSTPTFVGFSDIGRSFCGLSGRLGSCRLD